MFTGIIQHLGEVKNLHPSGQFVQLAIDCGAIAAESNPGDSIAINGACLTVTSVSEPVVTFDVVRETLTRTNLSKLNVPDRVNVEPSLRVGDKISGHFVTGHIDGIAQIEKKAEKSNQWDFCFKVSPELSRFMIQKGSVAVDGISLTIVEVDKDYFTVAVIPHTLEKTTLGFKKPADVVNIETDMFGKWVYKYVEQCASKESTLTEKFLKNHGFA